MSEAIDHLLEVSQEVSRNLENEDGMRAENREELEDTLFVLRSELDRELGSAALFNLCQQDTLF